MSGLYHVGKTPVQWHNKGKNLLGRKQTFGGQLEVIYVPLGTVGKL